MTNKKYYSILIIDKDKEFILIRYLFLERVVTFKRQESMGLFRTEEEKMMGYPSIDKPWLNYYSDEVLIAELPECTIYENIYQHNVNYLNQTALEYFGIKISYKKLFEQIDLCARALTANGIKRGSIVNICSSATPEITYLVLACSKIGAVANFINPLFETQQKIERINETNSEILFVLDKMYPYMKEVFARIHIKKIVIISATNSLPKITQAIAGSKEKKDKDIEDKVKEGKYIFWNEYIKINKSFDLPANIQYQKDMPVIMVYSSGTTGASKAIVLSNDGINATILQYDRGLIAEVKRGNRFLHTIPVWFSTGVVITLLMPLCLGVTCILEPVFSPEKFLNDMVKYKPNYALVATSLWLFVIEHIDKEFDLSFLKYPITGGEQMLVSTEMSINDFLKRHNCNAKMQKGWGMCELGATAATTVFSKYNKFGSVGIPMPFAVISAFDVNNGKELKYNERGELRVLTPGRMKEYYNNSIATDNFFNKDSDGNIWCCTGDIGYIDKDGFVFVLGRATDLFIAPDGKKYYLFDTENVILKNDFVDTCKIVAINSENLRIKGLVAHLVLKRNLEGDTNSIIYKIDKMCKEKLSKYAVPIAYKIRESLPINPSGKCDVLALRNECDGFLCVMNGNIRKFYINNV